MSPAALIAGFANSTSLASGCGDGGGIHVVNDQEQSSQFKVNSNGGMVNVLGPTRARESSDAEESAR